MNIKYVNAMLIIALITVFMFLGSIQSNGLEDHKTDKQAGAYKQVSEIATRTLEAVNINYQNVPTDIDSLTYSKEDLYLMSHLINGEAGCNWFTDERQQLVGLVVMNRVRSEKFPNTIKEVIFDEGQYSSTWDGNFDKTPSERAIENAKKVLTGETDVQCPENVVYQAEFKQGSKVYMEIYDEILNTTTYFCHQ